MIDPRPAYDARFIMHLTLTLIMTTMALQLFLPTETFQRNEHGQVIGNWIFIAAHMTEHQCAAWFTGVSVVGLLGMVSHRPTVRILSTALLGLAHGLVAATFIWSNLGGIGSLLLAGYAAQGAYLTYRRIAGAGV